MTLAPPSVVGPTVVVVKLALTKLLESATRWREGNALPQIAKKPKLPVGTTFRFALNEPAAVKLVFTQQSSGRKVAGRCVPPTRRNKHKRRCTRTVTVATLSLQGHAGNNSVRFQGRVSRHKKLRPGRYTLTITATDASGLHTTPQSVSFTIVKP